LERVINNAINGDRGWNVRRSQIRPAHVNPDAVDPAGNTTVHGHFDPGIRLDPHAWPFDQLAFHGIRGDTAKTIATHLRTGSVRVVHPHPQIAGGRPIDQDESVTANPRVPI
jgi:hypothetical protein